MKTITHLVVFWAVPFCLAASFFAPTATIAIAQESPTEKCAVYAITPAAPATTSPYTIKIAPTTINVVSACLGELDKQLRPAFMNHMNLWVSSKKPGTYSIKWNLQAPSDAIYDVSAIVLPKGSQMSLTCSDQTLESTSTEENWGRVYFGKLRLISGRNSLQLTVDAADGFAIDALELTQPAVKAAMLAEALAMRQEADWFKDAGYGLMFQWTNRATPPAGPIKPWEQKVKDFDVPAFADMVKESGAGYVVWSITWGQQYISAPLQSLDRLILGRTTKRDLLGEMADALHERGIKLIFYYHYGYDCGHSIDADWMKASGGYDADKTRLYQNLKAIFTEIGDRYGGKLNGWWFDGGQRYYDCHFDRSSPAAGILSAPFKELTQAARTGNAERLVSYNSWIKPRLTEYQDYYGGEGHTQLAGVSDGIFAAGGQEGLQGHGCFIFEKRWGHIEPNTSISKPRYNLQQLTRFIQQAQNARHPLSINLEMYEDGSVSPDSIALLEQLREVIRGK